MSEHIEEHTKFTFEDVPARLLQLADTHGQNSAPHNEVADLQDYFQVAWKLMSPGQRSQFLRDALVAKTLERGGHEPTVFDADELDEGEVEDALQFFGHDTSFQYTDVQVLDAVNAYRLHPDRGQPAEHESPRQGG